MIGWSQSPKRSSGFVLILSTERQASVKEFATAVAGARPARQGGDGGGGREGGRGHRALLSSSRGGARHGLLALFPLPADVSSSARWPVRARNTSSRLALRSANSASSIDRSSNARMMPGSALPPSTWTLTWPDSTPMAGVVPSSALKQLRDRAQVGPAGRGHLEDLPPGARLELVRRSGRDDRAVVDDRDVVRELVGLLQVLRGEQHRGAVRDELRGSCPRPRCGCAGRARWSARRGRARAAGRPGWRPGRGGGACRLSRSWRPARRRR